MLHFSFFPFLITEGSVKMEYVPSLERLVTTNQGVFSLRKHLNGLLFLDNVFQQPINFADDQVTLELSLNDVSAVIYFSIMLICLFENYF